MPSATVTSKGQITMPRAVRRALGLRTGDRVAFRLQDGSVHLEVERVELADLFGSLRPAIRGVSVDEMGAAVARRAARS